MDKTSTVVKDPAMAQTLPFGAANAKHWHLPLQTPGCADSSKAAMCCVLSGEGSFGAGKKKVDPGNSDLCQDPIPSFPDCPVPFPSSDLHQLCSWKGSEETHRWPEGLLKSGKKILVSNLPSGDPHHHWMQRVSHQHSLRRLPGPSNSFYAFKGLKTSLPVLHTKKQKWFLFWLKILRPAEAIGWCEQPLWGSEDCEAKGCPRFQVTLAGLGTEPLWITGHTCTSE